MTISKRIKEWMEQSSWIRRMFEEGMVLKAEYGEENVFDFTLGNPDLEPPFLFSETLQKVVGEKRWGNTVTCPMPVTRKPGRP